MNELLIILIPILIQVESGGDSNAIGDKGAAVGILQLHKVYVDDVNRIYGTKYTYEDRKNANASVAMAKKWLFYWGKQYEKKTGKKATMEVLARMHNGGPKGWERKTTDLYWYKVEKTLKEMREK